MATSFRLSVASPTDQAAVTALLEASYATLMATYYDPVVLDRALPLMTRANPNLLGSGTYYLAHDSMGSVVGCGGWTKERPGTGEIEPRLAHIRHFATHPGWLGRGIGRAIFTECRNAAEADGICRLECYSSLNAEGFYAAIGFHAVRRLEVSMGPDISFPSILMQASV
jgi:N-acetylglutamate synthase-like GNAT family acetyltransferase